jgi:hypothetical protein
MSVRDAVIAQVKIVAEQQRKTLQSLTDDMPLVGSGLDSLCIALVVANLEDELGVDPFGVDPGRVHRVLREGGVGAASRRFPPGREASDPYSARLLRDSSRIPHLPPNSLLRGKRRASIR